MPIYEFIANDGTEEYLGHFMEYDDAPDIGATVEINGRKWTRIPSMPVAAVKNFKPFVSYTQAPVPPGVDPETSGIICDAWHRDPDSGEMRAVYTKEETAIKNAAASRDEGPGGMTWDDKP